MNRKQVFSRHKGGIHFNPRRGVHIDHGIEFDPKKGVRIFFHYRGTPNHRSYMSAKKLRSWCSDQPLHAPDMLEWFNLCMKVAAEADEISKKWEEAGKPDTGKSLEEFKSAVGI